MVMDFPFSHRIGSHATRTEAVEHDRSLKEEFRFGPAR